MARPHPAVQFCGKVGVEFFPSVGNPDVGHAIPLYELHKEDGHSHCLLVRDYFTFWLLAEIVLHNDDVTIPVFILR